MTLSRLYQLIIICCIVLAVYYSVLFAPVCFVDDAKLILYDVAESRLEDLFLILFSGGGYYRPLVGATFILDNYFWMLEESFLHLENIILHGVNAVLLFSVTERLAKRLRIPPTHGIPFITALLFALHPLATESVNWISGRTDPLASVFLLLSIKRLIDWLEAPTTGTLIKIQLYYFLACLAKETAVFYIGPALLLAMMLRVTSTESVSTNPSWRSLFTAIRTDWLINACFSVTTIAYFALRRYAAITSEGKDRSLNMLALNATNQNSESFWFDKLLEVFRSIGFYTKKIIAPWPLNFNLIHVSDWYILFGLFSVMLLAYFCWHRRDLVAVLLLSAFLIGSSALLVSVGKLAWTTYAERYLYIPLIFFIPAAVMLLHEKIGAVRNGQLFRVVIILLCGASLITTVQRNLVWMDSPTFYELNYCQAPNLPITIRNYSRSLQQEGRLEEAGKIFKLLPKKSRAVKGATDK